MGADFRVAIYYCPPEHDPLYAAGAAWLGRDPESGTAVAQPPLPEIEAVTAEPRLYGFHATLKPPMRLAEGCSWPMLLAAVEQLAGRIAPFDLPPLVVADLHGFLALRETTPCAPLQALADACVGELDRFRAPPSAVELERRRRARLTAAQEAMLVRFGYPYVFDTWFFHMTLTRRLSAAEHAVWRPAAERHFAGALAVRRPVTGVCLFAQSGPGEAFALRERVAFRG